MSELQLHTGGKKEKRRELDYYPTPGNVTQALMMFLELPKGRIWEPACGSGCMSRIIEAWGHEVYSSDISDYGFGNTFKDFLTHTPPKDNFDAVITNPPFKYATAFIEKSLTHAPIVAMLLKSQFWHSKNRQKLFKDHTPAYILPLTWRPDFYEFERHKSGAKKGAPTMEVIRTIWMKGNTGAQYIPLLKP